MKKYLIFQFVKVCALSGIKREGINGVLGSLSTIALLIVCGLLKLHLKVGVLKLSVDDLNCS